MAVTLPLKRTELKVKDAKKPVRGKFDPSKAAQDRFFKQLKKVAKEASRIVKRHSDGAHVKDPKKMQAELDAYAEKLKVSGWAARQSAAMLKTVSDSNERAYKRHSKAMAKALSDNVAASDVGDAAFVLLQEQVGLIQSIPVEAGLRAQEIAARNFLEGTRAVPDQSVIDELVNEMGLTAEVAINRAKLIARTETARANATFVQARANAVGSTQYIWRNSGDGAVRESHRIYHGHKLDGMKFSWAQPPTLDDGMTGHPGTFPNCRCYAEPILPDLD
jgi:SPP1 gp7 family putative phage head morphogenesis protein